VEKVAVDVEAGRVTVTGAADAPAVATSVQVRTRRPVTVIRDGRRSGTQGRRSAAAAGTPREHQLVRARGRTTAAQVRPVAAARQQPEDDEIAGRPQAQEQVGPIRVQDFDSRAGFFWCYK